MKLEQHLRNINDIGLNRNRLLKYLDLAEKRKQDLAIMINQQVPVEDEVVIIDTVINTIWGKIHQSLKIDKAVE